MAGFWHVMSFLGDSNVTMPAAVTIGAWYAFGGARRLALSWLLLFGGMLAIVAISKLAFLGWGIGIESLDFTGFSGHAMRAAAVFPVAFALLAGEDRKRFRAWLFGAGLLLAVMIAVSRVAVHAHSVSEAVTGCLLGMTAACIFMKAASRELQPRISRWIVAAGLFAVVPAAFSAPAPTEYWLRHIAVQLSGREKAFTRAEWHRQARARRMNQGSLNSNSAPPPG